MIDRHFVFSFCLIWFLSVYVDLIIFNFFNFSIQISNRNAHRGAAGLESFEGCIVDVLRATGQRVMRLLLSADRPFAQTQRAPFLTSYSSCALATPHISAKQRCASTDTAARAAPPLGLFASDGHHARQGDA